MNKKIIAGISGVALAAGIGLGATQLANADNTETPTPSATSSAAPGESGKQRGGKGGGRGLDTAALAEKLGVSQEDLDAAIKAAREANQPSADGTTSTDREAARAEREAAMVKAIASELGLDEAKVQTAVDELQAERDAERAAAAKEKLATAVTDGTLTQEEADAVQKAIDAGIVSIGGKGR